MRPIEQYRQAMGLVAEGTNDCAISRMMGIPRRTILGWRHMAREPGGQGGAGSACPRCSSRPLDSSDYSLLLGFYLGDGCISPLRRTFKLRVALDQRYPRIIEACIEVMKKVRGPGRIGVIHAIGCDVVYSTWKHWPCVFPPHGPGPKHLRSMRLHSWQEQIVGLPPRELIRPRYQFTSHSEDILYIFTEALDLLGVRWRRSSWKVVSIARRPDVAFLDAFIGSKV